MQRSIIRIRVNALAWNGVRHDGFQSTPERKKNGTNYCWRQSEARKTQVTLRLPEAVLSRVPMWIIKTR